MAQGFSKNEKTKNRGVFSIPVTPFNEDGSVDYESLRRCVAYCVEAGAHGIVMPVNASEGPRLTDEERRGSANRWSHGRWVNPGCRRREWGFG